jgi:hypothetical protein
MTTLRPAGSWDHPVIGTLVQTRIHLCVRVGELKYLEDVINIY